MKKAPFSCLDRGNSQLFSFSRSPILSPSRPPSMDDLRASYKEEEEEEEWSDALDISCYPHPKMAKPQRTASSILKTLTSLLPPPPRSRHPTTLTTTSTAPPPPGRSRSLSLPFPSRQGHRPRSSLTPLFRLIGPNRGMAHQDCTGNFRSILIDRTKKDEEGRARATRVKEGRGAGGPKLERGGEGSQCQKREGGGKGGGAGRSLFYMSMKRKYEE